MTTSHLPALVLGLALGGSGAWLALRPSTATTASAAAAPAPAIAPEWAWRDSPSPPLFADGSASAAISGWLRLRAEDGSAPTFASRAASLRALVIRLPATAFPRLIEALSRSSNDDDLRLRRIAFTAWTTHDPAAATRWAAAAGDKTRDLAREALDVWADQDPTSAASWACAIPDIQIARDLSASTLAALAAKDGDRALALARSRDTDFRDYVMSAILRALGQKDPAGTLRSFAPDLWKNGAGFNQLRGPLAAWAKQDPQAAIAWLIAQPRDAADRQLAYWLTNLGDNSSDWRRTVATAIVAAPGVGNRAEALQHLLFSWGTSQPAEAVAWLNSLADPDLRIALLERVARTHYSDSPEKSLPLILAMPEGANRSQSLARILGSWAKLNSDATLAWMRDHQNEPGIATASNQVHSTLLAELAREDPAAAVKNWQAITDPKARQTAAISIAQAWGKTDPAAALQWAESLEAETQLRSYGGYRQLITQWAQRDPEAALRWVEGYIERAPEEARDYINSEYIDALGGDWETKLPRASTADLFSKIADPKKRFSALSRHVGEWLTKDPDAARAWVAASPALTAEQRAAILDAAK